MGRFQRIFTGKIIFFYILLLVFLSTEKIVYTKTQVEENKWSQDAVEQYILGRKLFDRAKKEEEVEEALKYLESSAKQKYLPAILFLAQIYERGYKVKPDFLKSFKWYDLAKKLGSSIGAYKLSFLNQKPKPKEFLLFKVPIFSINLFGIRYTFQKMGAIPLKLFDKKDFCDVFDTSSLFIGTDRTQLCYLPSKKLAFFELRFPYKKDKQNIYLNKYYFSLKKKYGSPERKKNIYIWKKFNIEILLWLEPKTNTVFLRYRDPQREKELLKIKKEMEEKKILMPFV